MAFENLADDARIAESQHYPSLHWVGCPQCGFALNVTIPVLRHATEMLEYLDYALEGKPPSDVQHALQEVIMWNNEVTGALRERDPEFDAIAKLHPSVAEIERARAEHAKLYRKQRRTKQP